MSELRKPCYVFLLKNLGKRRTNKIELFERKLFTDDPMPRRHVKPKYRIRVNGQWFPKGQKAYFASWEIKDLLWKSLPL